MEQSVGLRERASLLRYTYSAYLVDVPVQTMLFSVVSLLSVVLINFKH
jgi:hypothetical protein